MLRIAALAALMLVPALPAAANDEARLNAVVSHLLSSQKSAFEKTGGSFVTSGDTLIERADKYYAVTLPDITLVHPNKSRTALGLIALNASPAGDKKWNITMALPTPIVTKDAQDGIDSEVILGRQYFAGLWNEDFQNFTSLKTTYNNVQMKFPKPDNNMPFSSATLNQLAYGFDLADTSKEKTNVGFRLGLEGLNAQGLSATQARLFPSDGTVNVDIKDVPMDKLGDIQEQLLSPDKATGGGLLWIVSLLNQAGSEMTINKIELKNAQTGLLLTGKVKPAPNSPLAHTGNLMLDITRIDQLLLGLNESAAGLPAKEQAKTQVLRMALTMMSALGKTAGDAKRYDIEMTPDGKVLMNGTDFTAVLGPLLTPANKTAGR